MNVGVIGVGAIGSYVRKSLERRGHTVRVLLVRAERVNDLSGEFPGVLCVRSVAEIPDDVDLMIDCAGATALKSYGSEVLRRGISLVTVSIGALANEELSSELEQAAIEGNAKLFLASGAIGALDCLRAARVGELAAVTYIGRKPPKGWKGSPAEERLDLDNMKSGEQVHFEGSARDAATQYPKNANVAAAVGLAGVGMDNTKVKLIADPNIDRNVHEVLATGDFGEFKFEIRGYALSDNPKSSALAAMSTVSRVEEQRRRICF